MSGARRVFVLCSRVVWCCEPAAAFWSVYTVNLLKETRVELIAHHFFMFVMLSPPLMVEWAGAGPQDAAVRTSLGSSEGQQTLLYHVTASLWFLFSFGSF